MSDNKQLELPAVDGEGLGKLVAVLPAPDKGRDVRELWFCSRLNDEVRVVWLDMKASKFLLPVATLSPT